MLEFYYGSLTIRFKLNAGSIGSFYLCFITSHLPRDGVLSGHTCYHKAIKIPEYKQCLTSLTGTLPKGFVPISFSASFGKSHLSLYGI